MDVHEFIEDASDFSGYLVASLTDQYIVDNWPMTHETLNGKEDKVLELRLFNTMEERKLFRGDISASFMFRACRDDGRDYYDEIQYLDIDESRIGQKSGQTQGEMEVYTTGGGKYYLPAVSKMNIKNAAVKVRYYFGKYHNTGQARVETWRLVDIVEGR